MDDAELIRNLVRLGLKGDASSVRRLARKVARERLSEQGTGDAVYQSLSEELEASVHAPRVARKVDSKDFAAAHELLREVDTLQAGSPVVAESVAKELDLLVQERLEAAKLEKMGLEPSRSVLFTGPPGVGKTMAAAAIARKLNLPLLTVDLGLLMSSHLGRSGRNLKEAIRHAQNEPCVLFLDEFDSLAKSRDDLADVGELKRLVNLLLIELDSWPTNSLLLAATNHPHSLDSAVWRRFDRIVEFPLPDFAVRKTIARETLKSLGEQKPSDEVLNQVAAATDGESGALLRRFILNGARHAVLAKKELSAELQQEAMERLLGRAGASDEAREMFCRVASQDLGWTQRRIGEHLGISHVMVGKILRGARQNG